MFLHKSTRFVMDEVLIGSHCTWKTHWFWWSASNFLAFGARNFIYSFSFPAYVGGWKLSHHWHLKLTSFHHHHNYNNSITLDFSIVKMTNKKAHDMVHSLLCGKCLKNLVVFQNLGNIIISEKNWPKKVDCDWQDMCVLGCGFGFAECIIMCKNKIWERGRGAIFRLVTLFSSTFHSVSYIVLTQQWSLPVAWDLGGIDPYCDEGQLSISTLLLLWLFLVSLTECALLQ